MKKYLRQSKPECLKQNSVRWNKAWKAKVENRKSKSWNWYRYEKQPVNKIILENLLAGSNNECAFCSVELDKKYSQLAEIEHFKPKVKYPDLAFEWTNLYPCCHCCNRTKLDIDNCVMLAPDHIEYQTDWLEVEENKLIVSSTKCPKKYIELLKNTIKIYQLDTKDFFRKYIIINNYDFTI